MVVNCRKERKAYFHFLSNTHRSGGGKGWIFTELQSAGHRLWGEELQSDNKARKDEFNSFNPATIKVFLGANPARVERSKVIENYTHFTHFTNYVFSSRHERETKKVFWVPMRYRTSDLRIPHPLTYSTDKTWRYRHCWSQKYAGCVSRNGPCSP